MNKVLCKQWPSNMQVEVIKRSNIGLATAMDSWVKVNTKYKAANALKDNQFDPYFPKIKAHLEATINQL